MRAAGPALDTKCAALALPHFAHEGSGKTVPSPSKALGCSVSGLGQDRLRGRGWTGRSARSVFRPRPSPRTSAAPAEDQLQDLRLDPQASEEVSWLATTSIYHVDLTRAATA